MGFITMGQALQLIGQAPVQHGNVTAIEGKRAAKSLFPMFGGGGGGASGSLSGLLQQVTGSGGMDGILKNPMAAVSGALGGQLSSVTSLLGGLNSNSNGAMFGQFSSVIQSISGAGGLQSAIGNLTGTANSLVGLPGTGAFDLQSVIGHAGLSNLGIPLPASASMQTVLGPVQSTMHLGNIADFVSAKTPLLAAGQMAPADYITQIYNFTTATNDIVTASNYALMGGQNMTMASAALSVVTDAVKQNYGGVLGDFINSIIVPDARMAIDAHQAEIDAMFTQAVVPPA